MTFGDWLDTWLELYVYPNKLAPSTKACYNRAVGAVPASLREVPLPELSVLQVRRWLLEVARVHPRAAQLDRLVVMKALTMAEKAGMGLSGRFDADTLPQLDHEPAKAAVLNEAQMRAYMEAAARTDAAPVLLLCCCGCRRGEAWGARWEHIDLKAGTFAIVGQRVGNDFAPLKTKASARVIALPPAVTVIIRQQRRQLAGWVCDISQQRVYAAHRAALAAAGLPFVTLHGLRHTFATLAVEGGVPMKLVQGALGHAHFAVTADVYANHLPSVSAVSAHLFG